MKIQASYGSNSYTYAARTEFELPLAYTRGYVGGAGGVGFGWLHRPMMGIRL